jgi:hypothetical protein
MMNNRGRTFTDTSDFFAIGPEDKIFINGRYYLVKGEEREYRFGIEDPKFWVKKVVDCQNQQRKIIKLTFAETFMTSLGGVKIRCFRDPQKEGDILKLVRGNPFFMQGETYYDSQNNPVRILDIVRGQNFLYHIDQFKLPHKTYFWTVLPDILKHLIEAFKAISYLHQNGFRHGDIRNDHIFVERSSGCYVWIDFDYDFELPENPFGLDIFGLGNVLIYAIGKGFHDYYNIVRDPYIYKDLNDQLALEDFSILHKSRLVNLRKFYPYIPPMLNNVLMHFSKGAHIFYESVQEIVEDINGYLKSI